MDEWTNKQYEHIYYSRFIASWAKEGGSMNWMFKEWLKTITINGNHLPDDVVEEIYFLGTNGKLELEESAKYYISH